MQEAAPTQPAAGQASARQSQQAGSRRSPAGGARHQAGGQAAHVLWLRSRRTCPLSPRSDEVGKAAAMQGLQRLEGYVRKHVGKQVGKHVGKHVAGQRADGAAQPLP
jgi:hypothetical protein